MKKNIWLIHAGRQDELGNQVESKKAIPLSWSKVGDLSSLSGLNQYKEKYKASYPDAGIGEANIHSKQIFQFAQEVKEGDYIFTFIKDKNEYIVGTIQGKYSYQPSIYSNDYPHIRNVQWLKSVPVSSLSASLQKSLENKLMVTSLTKHQEEVNILISQNESEKKGSRLSYIVAIVGIIGGILAIIMWAITFVPKTNEAYQQINRILRDPSGHLKIVHHKVNLSSQRNRFNLLDDDYQSANVADLNIYSSPTPCRKRHEEECEAFIYLGSLYRPFSLDLSVYNDTDSHIVINGIEVTLIDYTPLDSEVTDLLYTSLLGGGAFPPTRYRIDYLNAYQYSPRPPDKRYHLIDPQQVLNTSTLATLDCQTEPGCENIISTSSNENEALALEIGFIDNLPPGWYEFEAAVSFSFQGKVYATNDKVTFDIIKPSYIRVWRGPNENSLTRGLVDISLIDNKYISQIPAIRQQNPPGHLVFQVDFGFDSTQIVWNLQSGEMHPVGTPDYIPRHSTLFNRSADGWKIAAESVTSILEPDQFVEPSDIIIADLKTESRYLRQTSDLKEMYPQWSPSSQKLAYVAYAIEDTEELKRGEADIYIFDMQTMEHHRITSSPTVLEAAPVWLNENQLAYLVPFVSDDYSKISSFINEQTGIGIIDLNSGESQFTYIDNISEEGLVFFEASNYLAYMTTDFAYYMSHPTEIHLYNLINKTSQSLPNHLDYSNNIGELRYGCNLLDTLPIKRLCFGDQNFIYDDSSNTSIPLPSLDNSIIGPIGTVDTGGFVVINASKGLIHQYDLEGNLVQDWLFPEAKELLAWRVSNLMLITNN